MKRHLMAVAVSLLAVSAVHAADPVATLGPQDGVVLVNDGEEFVTATDAQVLAAGDQIMVMEGAAAEIVFADGCALPLSPGSLVVVPAQSPCAGGVVNVRTVGRSYAQSGGRRSSGNGTLIIAGTALVAAVLIENEGYSDDGPVSP